MSKNYDDIIDLPHPISRHHAPMAIADRAAQFSPFAALTGHGAAVAETARVTDCAVVLDEDEKLAISETLCCALENSQPVTITYFQPDERKDGGAYLTFSGTLRRIDTVEHLLIFKNSVVIPIETIREAFFTD